MEVGKRIRLTRIKRGIEQLELANKVDISQSKMNKIETGFQKRIEPDILSDIAKALNTSIDYLVDGPREDGSFDSLEELRKMVEDYNVQDLFFHNIDDWKNFTQDDIEDIRNYIEFMQQKAKKRKEK